jgi:uncharacterized protein YhbP (UPF0306 family)
MVPQEVAGRILAFLSAHNTLTLATERDGKPWATALFYANDGFTLYFLSDRKTRHAAHLRNNPHVAATIQDDQRDWRAIQGVQLEGTCEEIADPIESARVLVVYAGKFPFIGDLVRLPKELRAAMASARFHKITPSWVRLIDNTRGLGYKEEIHPEGPPRD